MNRLRIMLLLPFYLILLTIAGLIIIYYEEKEYQSIKCTHVIKSSKGDSMKLIVYSALVTVIMLTIYVCTRY